MHGWLLWLGLTVALSAMGVGLASFQSGLSISGTVGTGNADVRFILDKEPSYDAACREIEEPDADENGEPEAIEHDAEITTSEDSGSDEIEMLDDPKIKVAPVSDREIKVSIENAIKGDRFEVKYGVENPENTGSVPVTISVEDKADIEVLDVDNELDTDKKLEPGDSVNGTLTIEVLCDEEETHEDIMFIELAFEQWNAN